MCGLLKRKCLHIVNKFTFFFYNLQPTSISMADNIGVHWFRLDLRLSDNPSIENLSKNVASIMPIYIYDENQNIGAGIKMLARKSLKSLNSQLNKLNSRLYIFRGHPEKIISKILQNKNITHVYWNRLYDEDSISRDKNIKSSLQKKSISCQSFNGYLLTEPWNIQNKSGSFLKFLLHFGKPIMNYYKIPN